MANRMQIPADIVQRWQEMVDRLAAKMRVASALIMRAEVPNIRVFVASDTQGNPWHRDEVAPLVGGTYCEAVMERRQPLLVPDARQDENWKSNPDVELGMIFYLGMPITWPDDEMFGTICVLDNKKHEHDEASRNLLLKCRDQAQLDLTSLSASEAPR